MNPASPPSGRLIVIEGIDGTGKSTQAKLLASWLESLGHSVKVSREPTDGPWGKRLRDSANCGRLTPEDELEYFLNDRRQHVDETILPAIADGKIVILDRYYFSSMAYQGIRGLDPAMIRKKNEEFAPVPDLLLVLDLDVDTAVTRIGNRGDQANEFEQREALQRCRDLFLQLANEPFARQIDSAAGMDEVSLKIRKAVSEAISL